MNDDMNSLRCCACNTLFAPVYHEDKGFEELCNTCLSISLGYNDYADPAAEFLELTDGEGMLQVEDNV